MSWHEWYAWVLDGLFPPTCVVCEDSSAWLCDACREGIQYRSGPLSSESCPKGLDACYVMGEYADPILRRLLTQYKYHSVFALDQVIRACIATYRDRSSVVWPWDHDARLTVTSTPTDALRVRTRGFDHASRLAGLVRAELAPRAVHASVLGRKRKAKAHATLPNDALRVQNVQDLFYVTKPVDGAVLLVDDVCTSGATMSEAARCLRAVGAGPVYGFALAKG